MISGGRIPGRCPPGQISHRKRTMDLQASTALVTGGASGLGAATVRHLHAKGANVVIFDRDATKGEALAADLGDRVVFVAGDVVSADDTAAGDRRPRPGSAVSGCWWPAPGVRGAPSGC